MTHHDESLELGIAAGLDFPTALVISEQPDDRPPSEPHGDGYGWPVVLVLVIGLAAIFCWLW